MVYFRAHKFLNGFKLVQERKVPYGDSLLQCLKLFWFFWVVAFTLCRSWQTYSYHRQGSHLHGVGLALRVLACSLLVQFVRLQISGAKCTRLWRNKAPWVSQSNPVHFPTTRKVSLAISRKKWKGNEVYNERRPLCINFKPSCKTLVAISFVFVGFQMSERPRNSSTILRDLANNFSENAHRIQNVRMGNRMHSKNLRCASQLLSHSITKISLPI